MELILTITKMSTTFFTLSPALAGGCFLYYMGVTFGSVSGGGFNPAIALGICISHYANDHSEAFEDLWIYFMGPIVGGVIGAALFLILRPSLNEIKHGKTLIAHGVSTI